MYKKIGSILTVIATVIAISLASSTVASGQGVKPEKPIKSVRKGTVTGVIRWSKTYGIIPMGPGNSQAAPSPCGQFYVAATVPSTGKAVVHTSGMTFDESGTASGSYYRPRNSYECTYSLKVPFYTPLYMIAGLGGTLLLPKIDETPMYLTDAWIGGNYNKPPKGTFRTFTGSQSINLTSEKPNVTVNFEMIYARPDNPK